MFPILLYKYLLYFNQLHVLSTGNLVGEVNNNQSLHHLQQIYKVAKCLLSKQGTKSYMLYITPNYKEYIEGIPVHLFMTDTNVLLKPHTLTDIKLFREGRIPG